MPKSVLITGCSQGGLGATMAKVYHSKGFQVFATLRNKSKAGDLLQKEYQHEGGIELLDLEVTSIESIRECASIVAKRTGGTLDILVNNAGVSSTGPLLDVSLDDAKKVYDANVWSVVAMAQTFAPLLIKAKGTMCNISSVSGELPFAWAGIYGSSRSAQTRISETLRLEMAPLGVRVRTVILGGVNTSGNNPANISDFELPPNSYYGKIIATLDRHKKVLHHPKKQNIDVAAKNVVEDTLSGNAAPFIRRGEASSLSWFCNTFLPYGLLVWMLNRESALGEIGFEETA